METILTPGGFTIKKCCASCIFCKFVTDSNRGEDISTRECAYSGHIRKNTDVCDAWQMSKMWTTAKSLEKGNIKNPKYIYWYVGICKGFEERLSPFMKGSDEFKKIDAEYSKFKREAHALFDGDVYIK